MNSQGNYREEEQTLLKRFQEIEPNEYRNIVCYYEENQTSIRLLSDVDQHKITRTYINALFELGDYHKYCQCCSDYIVNLFDTNNGSEDWRKDLADCLFKRSMAFYQLGHLDEAEETTDQVMRVDPYYTGVKKLYMRIQLYKKIEIMQGISAITILTAIMASLVIAVELFYVRPFYPELILPLETTRIVFFSFSVVHFFVAHSLLRLWMNRRANTAIRGARSRH